MSSLSTPASVVRISGAIGNYETHINGEWDLENSSRACPRYTQRNGKARLDYDANLLQWQLFVPSENVPVARLTCLSSCLLGKDPRRNYKWSSRLGAYRDEQSFIRSVAIEVEVASLASQADTVISPPVPPTHPMVESNPADGFAITGAGDTSIDGFWMATTSQACGFPVYQREDKLFRMVIEYSALTGLWLLHEETDRDNDAFAVAALPCVSSVPLHRASHAWMVVNREHTVMVKKPSIKVLTGKAYIVQRQYAREQEEKLD